MGFMEIIEDPYVVASLLWLILCIVVCTTILINRFKCKHEWENLKREPVFDFNINKEIPIAYDYILQCKKCGNIKKKRT